LRDLAWLLPRADEGWTPLILVSTLYSDSIILYPRHNRSLIDRLLCAARSIFQSPLIFKWQALVVSEWSHLLRAASPWSSIADLSSDFQRCLLACRNISTSGSATDFFSYEGANMFNCCTNCCTTVAQQLRNSYIR